MNAFSLNIAMQFLMPKAYLTPLQCAVQLEAQQGHKDDEAVAALAQLKQNMATLAQAEAVAAAASNRTAANAEAAPDEVQIAGVLDRSIPIHSCPQYCHACCCRARFLSGSKASNCHTQGLCVCLQRFGTQLCRSKQLFELKMTFLDFSGDFG